MSDITPGKRLFSAVSATEVIVVRAPARSTAGDELSCGGTAMAASAETRTDSADTGGPAVELGKRYEEETSGLEVLCTKAGSGPLVFGGRELTIKAAKALPSSD